MAGFGPARFVVLSLLAAGLVLPSTTASADTATLYVDIMNTSCSDTGAGTQAQPYCTLQAATDAAQPGDTVHVATGGTYPSTTVTTSGAPGQPVTISGANFIFITQLSFSGVHDVALRDMQLATGSVQIRDSSDVTLDDVRADGSDGRAAVDISGQSSDVTVSRSDLEAADVPGVEVGTGVQHTVITTNYLSSRGGAGTAVELDGALDTAVTSNTFESGAQGLSVTAGSTGTTAENNVLYGADIQVSADSAPHTSVGYNLFYPSTGGDLYRWAGTAYTDVPAFQAATGQGGMDLVGGKVSPGGVAPPPSEGYATIDSADADAPGELPTDINGRAHVNDPLVPDTGTGAGYVDRGANEFADPFHSYRPDEYPYDVEVGHPVTVTADDTNPWGDVITRTYDFGDGTPLVTSTADSVQHTYTTLGGSTGRFTITVTEAGGSYQLGVQVNPTGPLVAGVGYSATDASSPLGVTFHDASTDPFQLDSCTISFGDGTPAVRYVTCDGLQHTYAKAGTYIVTTTVTDAGGRSAKANAKVAVGPVFMPVGPTRILDTRTGLGARKAHVGAGGVVRLQVNGAGGITHATSVLLNVTVTDATGGGVITTYPGGAKRPTASNLNYRKGQTAANLVTVPVGSDGTVNLYNSAASVDLIADVEGYSTLTPGTGVGTVLTYEPGNVDQFAPVLDTRGGSGLPKLGKVGAGKSVTFTALFSTRDWYANEYGATAVVLDVTETNATAHSFVTAYQPGGSVPNASNLNFAAGETRSAMVVVPVDAQGRVSLTNHAGSVDLTATVEGYYLPFGPTRGWVNKPMTPITPVRVLDTRSGTGARKGPIPATGHLHFKVAGVAGIPADATGVLLNLTAVGSTANGSLTVWGDRSPYQPAMPALNFMRGQTTPVLVYLLVSHGSVGLYNPYGSVNVVADVEAYSTNWPPARRGIGEPGSPYERARPVAQAERAASCSSSAAQQRPWSTPATCRAGPCLAAHRTGTANGSAQRTWTGTASRRAAPGHACGK